MSKRTLLLVVALIVSLAVASTGTLAYLTATDSDVNVMTLGNVDIEQHEMKRAEGIAHNTTLADGDLVPFEEGIKLYPAYPSPDAASPYSAEATDLLKWGPYVHTGTAQNGLWNDNNLTGAVDKMVFVENTGSSDAYFRTVIAYECPNGIEIGEPSQGAEIMINENSVDLYGAMTERFVDYITVDGVRYKMFQYVYADALLPGEWAHPSLLQVVMTHNATSEDMTLLGETYEILVVTQAVATENMPEDAAEALNAAFGELSADSHPWMAEGEEGAQPPYESEPVVPVMVATAEELTEAVAAGQSVALTADIVLEDAVSLTKDVSIDLNGNTLTVSNLEAAADVTISGGTLEHGESTYPALSVKGGNLTMNDVEIINIDQPCNVFTSGSIKAVESVALQIFEGDCELNDCTIYIKHSEKVYASNIVGVSIHEGSLTMNGGSVTVESAGASQANYNNDAAFYTGRAGSKTINLNDVTLSTGDAPYLYATEGTTVVNTTDAADSWADKVTGTATVNYK